MTDLQQNYLQNDLDRYAGNLDDIDWDYSNVGDRAEALVEALPDDAYVDTRSSGGWQGELVIVVVLDGYYWVTNDWYGSCARCDSFMDNHREWTEQQLREFYCFSSLDDMKAYIEDTDSYDWKDTDLGELALDMIEDMLDSGVVSESEAVARSI